MKKLLISIFILLTHQLSHAQIGIPQINNYNNLDYKGGTQNWGIEQDRNGFMYFANNEGLLTYNGKFWNLYTLPNKTVLRSIKIDSSGKIFVGAQDEIGYFYPDKNGVLKFQSLRNLIPAADKQFSDVWDIVIIKNEVYFRTSSKIFNYKDGAIKVYRSEGNWEFLGIANEKIYAQDLTKGLLTLENGIWEPVTNHPDLKKNLVTSILNYNTDSLLITTLKNGLYILNGTELIKKATKVDQLFSTHRIYKAIEVSKNWYAFATMSAGCVIIDRNGEIKQQFTSTDGLQKNNIRSINTDQNQNLWLGLDNGIDFIAFNNAIKYINPDKYKQTSGYATRILHDKLYIGTSNGLFASALNPKITDMSYSNSPFLEVLNTQGQIWSLNEINKKLLVAHEDGAFVVDGNAAKQIYKNTGTWIFEPLSSYYPSKEIISGTYDGLNHLSFENNEFKNNGELAGIKEPLRFLVFDQNTNTIWASHPYRGIYRFKLSANKRKIARTWLYTHKDGLPSSLNNYIAKIKNRIVVATEDGIYEFQEAKKRFLPSEFLTPILGKKLFQYLNEDQYGNIWFVSNKKVGVVDFHHSQKDKKHSIVNFPELNSQVVAGFENIYPYNQENIFIGSDKGVIHINYLKYLENIKPVTVNLTQVKVIGKKDNIIFGGYYLEDEKLITHQDLTNKISVPYYNNSVHFEYSSTLFEQLNNIEFSYQLVGFDNRWSDWGSKAEKDYTNLGPGTYTFNLKARNNLGNECKPVSYTFTIQPAWYQTYWIYLLYSLILCGIVYLLIQRQKKKHIKEQQHLKFQHELEIEHSEKEIVKLQNEKLEVEVNFKNKELASTTMHLVQRGKLLAKIKEELLPIVKTDNPEVCPEEFKNVLRLLNEAERGDADWNQFSVHFDHVHSNFLTKLKEKFPSLSANDLKLCAYLKMNLSSKEIAQLMSITIRAVEVSRYRLRKKLGVSSDTNLFDYLIQSTT